MHLQLESTDTFSIQAYSNDEVKINNALYQQNLIVSAEGVISGWQINSLAELDDDNLAPLLQSSPKIILIGQEKNNLPPMHILENLSKRGIGMEFMSIGAACRTYNVLLSEMRAVVLGIIF